MRQSCLSTALMIVASFCLAAVEPQSAEDPESPNANIDPGDNELAQPGELRWMVMITAHGVYGPSSEYIFLCDGVLIHDRVVLVSNSSIAKVGPEDLAVLVGEWDISLNNEGNPTQERSVEKIVRHEPESGESAHQIAMLILSAPFNDAVNVGVVAISNVENAYDGSRCLVSGWGRTISNNDQTKLKKAEIAIVNEDDCSGKYNIHASANGDNGIERLPNTICAGDQQHPSMCESHHGSPLICPLSTDPSTSVLVGFDVSGYECLPEYADLPSQFASVTAAFQWINDVLLKNNMEPQTH